MNDISTYGTISLPRNSKYTVNCSHTGLSVIPEFAHTGPREFRSPAQKQLTVCFVQSAGIRAIPDFLYTGFKILVPTQPVRYKINWL